MSAGAVATEHWGPSLGPTVLDIGGEVGAAVVTTAGSLEGAELEIRRPPEDWEGRHVAVRARPGPGTPVFAAVFAGLPTGSYEIRVRGGADDRLLRVTVRGGEVATQTWPDSRVANQKDGRGTHVG